MISKTPNTEDVCPECGTKMHYHTRTNTRSSIGRSILKPDTLRYCPKCKAFRVGNYIKTKEVNDIDERL